MVRILRCLVLILLIGGCRSAPPLELPLAPPASDAIEAGSARSPTCRDLLDAADTATVEGRYQIVVAAVDAVRSGVCDRVDPDDRVCRSLFLIAATDPLIATGVGLSDDAVDALIEHHAWALANGRSAAEAAGDLALSRALQRLSGIEIEVDDEDLAAVAVARAAPEILEPIADAEVVCAGVPR